MRYKYPRTYHLSNSPGLNKKSRIQKDLSHLENMEVVVTIKMDGENTTMTSEYVHPRYVGIFDIDKIKEIGDDSIEQGHEGIIVRNSGFFEYKDFSKCVVKYRF